MPNMGGMGGGMGDMGY